jgi:hypothetical protein
MARREYTAGSPTTLASAFSAGATSFTITSDTNWPTSADYDFFVTIDGGTAQEERVLCSARTGTTVTVATGGRGKDSTGDKSHAAGATVWPSWSAQDADEANAHIESTGYASFSKSVHGLGSGDGVVVGTDKTQTLTAKTLASPTITGTITGSVVTSANIVDGTITGTDIASGTVTSTNIADGTIVNADISASAAIAASKLSGVVTPTSSDTLTNKNLTSPDITGGTLNGGAALTVTSTELNKLDGVSSTAGQIDALGNLIASRATVTNSSGNLASSTVLATEIGYLDGVTSAIQTQLNGRLETSRTGAKVYIQTSQPSSASLYDLWIDY